MNYNQARINMVDGQVETAGVTNESILKAFANTPREVFVPKDLRDVSYCDDELSIGEGRFLLEPLVHAKILQAARPVITDIVLDIGAGSGYSSAILSPLVSTVVALESNKDLFDQTSKLWRTLDLCNIAGIEGPLEQGAKEHAPFSLIIINGAVGSVPSNITDQLSDDGRLITIVKNHGETMGEVTLVQKNSKGLFSSISLFEASAQFLPGFENSQDFHF